MTKRLPWQLLFCQSLQHYLVDDEAVLALVVFGSVGQLDTAVSSQSDLDLLLVTTGAGLANFFPTVDWLRPFGTPYAFEQHHTPPTYTTRLCYEDMRRVDMVFMAQTGLQEYRGAKFWQPCRLVFVKDMEVKQQLLQPGQVTSFTLPTLAEFDQMVNQFWYRSSVAVYKVIQDDQLIAWHLALELLQDCCILGMMLRDRQEQTNHHRTGGIGNELVTQLPTWSEPYTSATILAMISQIAILFDDLAGQRSERYQPRKRPLLNWIQTIQTHKL